MAKHKSEVHNNNYDSIKYSTKNKMSSYKSSLNEQGLLSLMLDTNEIISRSEKLKSASEDITNQLIKDSARYWKEEAKNLKEFKKRVSQESVMSEAHSSSTNSGSSNTRSNKSRNAFASDEAVSSIDKLSNATSKAAQQYDKTTDKLSKVLTGAVTALAATLSNASNEVISRYNNVVLATGGRNSQEIYSELASSNRELAAELGSIGKNTISPEEISRMQQSVLTYYRKDEKMISSMTTTLVEAAEVGMDINTEFLRTSAYIYKQSGKNEKALQKTVDSIYSLASQTDNMSSSEVQDLAVDALKTGQLVGAKADKSGISFDDDEYWKSNLAARTALGELSGNYSTEIINLLDSLDSYVANFDPTKASSKEISQLESLTGLGVTELQSLQQSSPEDYYKLVVSSLQKSSYKNSGLLSALGFDTSTIEAAFRGVSTNDILSEFSSNMDDLNEESSDAIVKAISDQKVPLSESIANTLSEMAIDTIPPDVASIARDISALVTLVSGSSLLNMFTGGGGSGLLSGSGILSKGKGLISSISGSSVGSKIGSIFSGTSGKVFGGLAAAYSLYNGINGFSNNELISNRFGVSEDSITIGQRTSSGIGQLLSSGSSEGGLGAALGGAATGAAIGSIIPGIGTAVGAGIGGVLGAIGGDTIAQAIETNINQPLGAIGESLANGGDNLISSIGDLEEGVFDLWSNLTTGLGDTLGQLPIVGGLLEGTTDILGNVISGAGDLVGGLFDAGQGFFNWLTGNNGDGKSPKTGRPRYGIGGIPTRIKSIGTTKPNGDIDGPSPWTVTAGYRDTSIGYGDHDGVDYGLPVNTRLTSPTDGTVTYLTNNDGTNWGGGPGKGLIITDGQGRKHYMWHLNKINVQKGQKIKFGQDVGLSGNTGMSTGPHLHYGLYVNGKDVNPNITSPSLWGANTSSSSTSTTSTNSSPSIQNYITTSDGSQFQMIYSGGVPKHITRNSRVGSLNLMNPSNYTGWTASTNAASHGSILNVNNSEVVSELKVISSILNTKLDIISKIILSSKQQYTNSSNNTVFSMPY